MFDEYYFYNLAHLNTYIGEYTVLFLQALHNLSNIF